MTWAEMVERMEECLEADPLATLDDVLRAALDGLPTLIVWEADNEVRRVRAIPESGHYVLVPVEDS